MEVPVENTGLGDDLEPPAPMMQLINDNYQTQSIDLRPEREMIMGNWQRSKFHGEDIRRLKMQGADTLADIAAINARRICDLQEAVRRITNLEDAASIAEVEGQTLSDQHTDLVQEVWDGFDELRARISTAELDRQNLSDEHEHFAADIREEIASQLEEAMQRMTQETRDIIRGLQEQHEPPNPVADRLALELDRLSIDSDIPAPENDTITSDALVLRSARPTIRDARDGRIDLLERTLEEYYRRLRARIASVQRLGRANQTESRGIIREGRIHLANYTIRMQAMDALHTIISAELRDHALVLQGHSTRLSDAERMSRTHRAETDQVQRETDGRLQDQATRLEEIDRTLAGIADGHAVDSELRRHSRAMQHLEHTLSRVRLDQEDQETRLDETKTQLQDHSTNFQSTLDDHGSRLDATDTQLEGQSSMVRRIDGTLDRLLSHHEFQGVRLDTNDTDIAGISGDVARISGILDQLESSQVSQNGRIETTVGRVDLVREEHARMSQYIMTRVDGAMEGTEETGISRALEELAHRMEQLRAEVERSVACIGLGHVDSLTEQGSLPRNGFPAHVTAPITPHQPTGPPASLTPPNSPPPQSTAHSIFSDVPIHYPSLPPLSPLPAIRPVFANPSNPTPSPSPLPSPPQHGPPSPSTGNPPLPSAPDPCPTLPIQPLIPNITVNPIITFKPTWNMHHAPTPTSKTSISKRPRTPSISSSSSPFPARKTRTIKARTAKPTAPSLSFSSSRIHLAGFRHCAGGRRRKNCSAICAVNPARGRRQKAWVCGSCS
ncbi:MAG: hypothetical protein Q9216_004678 [Gyalolechia sp. 2 TL-2023]